MSCLVCSAQKDRPRYDLHVITEHVEPPNTSVTAGQPEVFPSFLPPRGGKKEGKTSGRPAVAEVFSGSTCLAVTCGTCRARSFCTETRRAVGARLRVI